MTRPAGILWLLFAVPVSAQVTQQHEKSYSARIDSTIVVTSGKYADPSLLKQVFLGNNYRKEWGTQVKLPVFHLSRSGLTIVELGGGQQTKSLELKDAKGRSWALRTIDKDVTPALPKPLRRTVAHLVVQDMVSAAHPYAPLTVAHLAKAARIPAPDPVFYYVAPDRAFGPYEHLFAGTVCMLEEREPTPDGTDTDNTEDMLENFLEKPRQRVLQEAVFRARLLDMLVADWDRHADQWRWGSRDSAGLTYLYAIPRDRDQAFFRSGGLLVKMARYLAAPHFQGFTRKPNDLKKLNYKSWRFDRLFLNELDRADWEEGIRSFQAALTDEVITEAVNRMPPEIAAIRGPFITSTLKTRRDGLVRQAMKYYRFLSHEVEVVGSEGSDYFEVEGDKGQLRVSVYTLEASGDKGKKVYERTFRKKETNRIRLAGLGGNDRFVIKKGTDTNIRIELSGSGGSDQYEVEGKAPVSVRDEEQAGKGKAPETVVLR
ncbi:MAG TPA: hypothetical protein VHK69_16440 [Chitinophagaceae bacterium]|nr:hypothetical protein [Chitinophagaceae bacterium]